MTALLSQDASAVHQALWSNSTFLSCFYYNALNVEQVLTDVRRAVCAAEPVERV